MPPYVNKHRAKTQYRQKDRGERQPNNSVMNRRIDRKKLQMRIGMPYRKSRQQSQMRENNVNLSTKGSGIVELSPIYLGDMMGHMLSPTLRETINL